MYDGKQIIHAVRLHENMKHAYTKDLLEPFTKISSKDSASPLCTRIYMT